MLLADGTWTDVPVGAAGQPPVAREFSSYVKTERPIPKHMDVLVQKITPHIKPHSQADSVLRSAPEFDPMWKDFGVFVDRVREACENEWGEGDVATWLGGHNLLVYDARLLWGNLLRRGYDPEGELAALGVRGMPDTLPLARAIDWGDAPPHQTSDPSRVSFSNGALYRRVTGQDLTNAHDATADCRATAAVLMHELVTQKLMDDIDISVVSIGTVHEKALELRGAYFERKRGDTTTAGGIEVTMPGWSATASAGALLDLAQIMPYNRVVVYYHATRLGLTAAKVTSDAAPRLICELKK